MCVARWPSVSVRSNPSTELLACTLRSYIGGGGADVFKKRELRTPCTTLWDLWQVWMYVIQCMVVECGRQTGQHPFVKVLFGRFGALFQEPGIAKQSRGKRQKKTTNISGYPEDCGFKSWVQNRRSELHWVWD
eukprot:41013-Amphidinium_carterae.1